MTSLKRPREDAPRQPLKRMAGERYHVGREAQDGRLPPQFDTAKMLSQQSAPETHDDGGVQSKMSEKHSFGKQATLDAVRRRHAHNASMYPSVPHMPVATPAHNSAVSYPHFPVGEPFPAEPSGAFRSTPQDRHPHAYHRAMGANQQSASKRHSSAAPNASPSPAYHMQRSRALSAGRAQSPTLVPPTFEKPPVPDHRLPQQAQRYQQALPGQDDIYSHRHEGVHAATAVGQLRRGTTEVGGQHSEMAQPAPFGQRAHAPSQQQRRKKGQTAALKLAKSKMARNQVSSSVLPPARRPGTATNALPPDVPAQNQVNQGLSDLQLSVRSGQIQQHPQTTVHAVQAGAQPATVPQVHRNAEGKERQWRRESITDKMRAEAAGYLNRVASQLPIGPLATLPGIPQDHLWEFNTFPRVVEPNQVLLLRCFRARNRHAHYMSFIDLVKTMAKSDPSTEVYWDTWAELRSLTDRFRKAEHNCYTTFGKQPQETEAQAEYRAFEWSRMFQEQAYDQRFDYVNKKFMPMVPPVTKKRPLDDEIAKDFLPSAKKACNLGNQHAPVNELELPEPEVVAPKVYLLLSKNDYGRRPKSKEENESLPEGKRCWPNDVASLPDYPVEQLVPNSNGMYSCGHEPYECQTGQCTYKSHNCCRQGVKSGKAVFSKAITTWRAKVERLIKGNKLDHRHKTWSNWCDERLRAEEDPKCKSQLGLEVQAKKAEEQKKKLEEAKKKAREAEDSDAPVLTQQQLKAQEAQRKQRKADEVQAQNKARAAKHAQSQRLEQAERKVYGRRNHPDWAYFDAWWNAANMEFAGYGLTEDVMQWRKRDNPCDLPDRPPVPQTLDQDQAPNQAQHLPQHLP